MAAINRSTDMTTGSIWKRMVSFAVPVFLGNLCQQLYNTVAVSYTHLTLPTT